MKKSVFFALTIVMTMNAVGVAHASERTAAIAGMTQEERTSLRADLQAKVSEAQAGIAALEKNLKEKQNNGASFDAFNSTSVSILLAATSIVSFFARAESVTPAEKKLDLKFAGLTALAALASTAVAISDIQFVNLTDEQIADLQRQIKEANAELETLQARLAASSVLEAEAAE